MPRRKVGSPFTTKVGARIRELRVDRNMSLGALATAGGISKGHLSSIEHGLAAINVETIERLARGLDLPPLYVLTFAEEDELARIAELARKLPQEDLQKVRRELQVRIGLSKR